MADVRTTGSVRYLPLVLVITLSIVGFPLAVLAWVETAFNITIGPLPAAAIAVALSAAIGAMGSALWIRHPRSRDIVFGDLMLWGYVRRLINQRRVLRATSALGLDRSDGGAREIALSRERQTEILQRLANALEANDPYTSGHSRRVARHSLMIARQMGLTSEHVDKIYTAASIHDVGKMHLPGDVLNKPGKLTDDEYELVKEHPAIGAAMVAALGNGEITAIVRHHHERLDGRGYPDRLEADAIPLGSRIIAVADTFDALTSTRPYRAASEHKRAIDILKKEAGAQLDGRVVEAFLRYYSGRRSQTWWSALTALPERLVTWLANGIERVGLAGLAGGATAAGAAAVIAASSIAGPAAMSGIAPVRSTANVEVAEAPSSTLASGDTDPDEGGSDSGRGARDDDQGNGGASDDSDGSSSTDSGGTDSGGGDSGGTDSGGSDSGGTDSGSDSGGGDSGGTDSGGTDSGGSDSGSGSDTDNSGSGSDSSGSGSDSDNSGSDSDNSGSGSDSSGSGSGDDDGLIGDVVDTVEDVVDGEEDCGVLGLLC
jgi:hypothetical protein